MTLLYGLANLEIVGGQQMTSMIHGQGLEFSIPKLLCGVVSKSLHYFSVSNDQVLNGGIFH